MASKTITIQVDKRCDACQGTGGKRSMSYVFTLDGRPPHIGSTGGCKECQGKGTIKVWIDVVTETIL